MYLISRRLAARKILDPMFTLFKYLKALKMYFFIISDINAS